MNATELLSRLTARGIRPRTVAGEIQVNRPGDIRADEREELRRLKPELVELIALRGREQPGDVLDPTERQRLMDETVVPAPCEPNTNDELFAERASIRQYDGGLSRADAETLARLDIEGGIP